MTISSTPARQDLDLEAIRLDLEIAETTRARQLANLPAAAKDDMVAVLHSESVERVLGEIRAALGRLDNGSYGLCTKCHGPIPPARLDLRPWAATCTTCAQR
jgi:DnaK suppressor protein